MSKVGDPVKLLGKNVAWNKVMSAFKVDWTFEILWDPLLMISPNLFFENNKLLEVYRANKLKESHGC